MQGDRSFSLTRVLSGAPFGAYCILRLSRYHPGLFDDLLLDSSDGHKMIPCIDAMVVSACSTIKVKELLKISERLLQILAGH